MTSITQAERIMEVNYKRLLATCEAAVRVGASASGNVSLSKLLATLAQEFEKLKIQSQHEGSTIKHESLKEYERRLAALTSASPKEQRLAMLEERALLLSDDTTSADSHPIERRAESKVSVVENAAEPHKQTTPSEQAPVESLPRAVVSPNEFRRRFTSTEPRSTLIDTGDASLIDHAIEEERRMQEVLSEDLVKLTSQFKKEVTKYGEVLRKDENQIAQLDHLTSKHLQQTKKETGRIKQRISVSCKGTLTLAVVLVCVLTVFFMTYSVIKAFPKRR